MRKSLEISKINLGCGDSEGKMLPRPWLNVDLASPWADYECDAKALPEAWSERFFEVRASHILEHTFLDEWPSIIREWTRVLKPGGVLRLVMPDLDIVTKCLHEGTDMKGRQSLSWSETTAVLAQIFGIGYHRADTSERWRHRMIINAPVLIQFLQSLELFSDIFTYPQRDDPAALNNIKDDSQNPFSLHVYARRKDGAAKTQLPLAVGVVSEDVRENQLGQILCARTPAGWRPVTKACQANRDVDAHHEFLLADEFAHLNQIIQGSLDIDSEFLSAFRHVI